MLFLYPAFKLDVREDCCTLVTFLLWVIMDWLCKFTKQSQLNYKQSILLMTDSEQFHHLALSYCESRLKSPTTERPVIHPWRDKFSVLKSLCCHVRIMGRLIPNPSQRLLAQEDSSITECMISIRHISYIYLSSHCRSLYIQESTATPQVPCGGTLPLALQELLGLVELFLHLVFHYHTLQDL